MTVLPLVPLLGGMLLALATAAFGRGRLGRVTPIVAAALIFGSAVALDAAVLAGNTIEALGGQLRADPLSAFMLTVIGAVGLTATWGGLGPGGASGRLYPTLIVLFLAAMSLAVLADNLGVLWVAVEATTVTTAFLVGFHRTRRSIEAAWKYVVLASVGVANALLGIVLLYAATRAAGTPTLSWHILTQADLALDPPLVRVAAGLAILGFATKAGLAPMHSWLPDAHSQAPAPVSGLMSGVLLSVSFYAILRVQAVVDPVIGSALTRGLLIGSGLLSLALAAALTIAQRDLKRLLAYSSIEHMGLLALAAAIGGPLAIGGALLHVLGHGLAKATAFLTSGWILAAEGTTTLAQLRGLLRRRPGMAVPLLVSVAALLALPPFPLFFSEVAIVVAGIREDLHLVMGLALVFLLITFAAIARQLAVICLETGEPSGETAPTPMRVGAHPRVAVYLALGVTAVLGFAAGPFAELLTRAAAVVTRSV